MKLTEEQKKRYIENPYECPVCGDDGIEWVDSPDLNANELSVEIECKKCHIRWYEIYQFVRIEER